MNDDVDEQYRRAAADQPSRPSEAVRQAVLAHAAAVAAERGARVGPTRPARAVRRNWRPAAWGAVAAAGLAGLLLLPRLQDPTGREQPARAASDVTVPSDAAQPAAPAAAPAPPRASALEAARRAEGGRTAKAVPGAPTAPRAADAGGAGAATSADAAQRPAARGPTMALAKTVPGGAFDSGAALRRAAAGGDVAGLRTLLDAGAEVDGRDAAGRTALLLAVISGHAEAVNLLLAHRADPNAKDAAGVRPLAAATAADRPAIAAALRRAGAR